MQVSVTKGEGLETSVSVAVPAERIESEVKKRLQSLSKRVRLNGFRPGKVPMRVVQQQYGPQVLAEVQEELMKSSFYEALDKENLRPAGSPRIEMGDSSGTELKYTATFEIYPEFEVVIPDALKVEKPVVELGEEDVGRMLDTLRQQRRSFEAVERAAETGDRLTIDFNGTLDGEPFEGGAAEGANLELGAGRFLKDFEDNLIGASAEEEKTFSLTFPEDYHGKNLAGKTVEFNVKVKAVSEAVLPEVDDEFAKSLGVETVDELKKELKETMQRECDQVVRTRVKRQILDAMREANPINLPTALITDETQRLVEQAKQELKSRGLPEDMAQSDGLEEEAKRRVTLGLVMAELIKKYELKPKADLVRKEVERMAASYEDPNEVLQWYYGDKERLADVEALVLEDLAVEKIAESAEIEEKQQSYQELTAAPNA